MSLPGVVVVGAGGRMGRLACEALEASEEFRLAGGLGSRDDLPVALKEVRAELMLDLTVAGLGFDHGRLALECGLRPVIGTSGVSLEETATLDRLARTRGSGGLVVPNFSLGAWVLERLARESARWFDGAAILEVHHPGKRDAPSASALELARQVEEVGRERGRQEPVPIVSQRVEGVVARQGLTFGAPGERLELAHEVTDRRAFRPGLLAALHHARSAEGVGRGLDCVFG